jgi:hypothetical protein
MVVENNLSKANTLKTINRNSQDGVNVVVHSVGDVALGGLDDAHDEDRAGQQPEDDHGTDAHPVRRHAQDPVNHIKVLHHNDGLDDASGKSLNFNCQYSQTCVNGHL